MYAFTSYPYVNILAKSLIPQPVIDVVRSNPAVRSDRELRDGTGLPVKPRAYKIFELKLHKHRLQKAQSASVRHYKDLLIRAFKDLFAKRLYPLPKVSVRLCIRERSVIGIVSARRYLMLVIPVPRLAVACARIHLSDEL